MYELCHSFAFTYEMMLIQKQHLFEIRLVVVNILINKRMQYRYDFKSTPLFTIP